LRRYFMRAGHIVSVEAIPGLSDQETIEKAWELSRMVFQYPTPTDDSA
jgi:hypothetical protein